MDFEGKVVIVTGGTGFLGSEVCRSFAEAGANVVAVYLFEKEFPFFRKTLGKIADRVVLEKADATVPGAMDRVAANVLRRFRRIDVLVNTVGGYMSGAVDKTSPRDFDAAVDLNLKSVFLACKAVIPTMRRQKRGKIVSMSSQGSLKGEAESFLYSATKAGVNRLTEALAEELKDANIQVNCVMPTILDTPANRKAMPDADFSQWVRTDHIARIILWLCSSDADAVTGAAIPI